MKKDTSYEEGNGIINFALLSKDIEYIKTELGDLKSSNTSEHKAIRELIDSKYVTKEEFEPFKKLVNYVLYIIIGAVVTALIALITRSK